MARSAPGSRPSRLRTGYTLLLVPTSHVINPSIYAKLPYDTERDFSPITMVASAAILMAVNSRGVFLGTKHAVLAMKQAGGGSIVNLSSISGNTGQTMTHMGYNASKGAVRTLTKSTAVQFGRDGIRANSVHPGLMPPMRTSGATADPTVRAKMLQGVPLRRAGEVDEVANAVLFLASDEASYITGAELYVDGGYLAT